MSRKMFKGMVLFVALAVMVPVWGSVWGAGWPSRNIELFIPYKPGGPSDTMGRSLVPKLEEVLGVRVIPVNKPGASGSLAFSLLAKRKPDGYTILIGSTSALTVVPNFQKVTYHPLKDLTFVCKLFNQSPVVVVRKDAPWKNFEEFLGDAKKNPKKIKYGSWGKYGSGHLAMEAIGKEKGIEWIFVPFKGDGPTVTALLGGHVDAAATAAGHVPQVRAGKLRILTMLQTYKSKVFPEAACLTDFGIKFKGKGSTETLSGIFAPKGLSKDVMSKYEDAFRQATKSPSFLRAANTMGVGPDFRSGKDLYKEVKGGYKYVSKLVKKLELK
jgi:tripartite-type tricarboxylate transporter receptor subunit TctC